MSAYSQEKLRLPLIRKVFRQDDTYICGLCKTDYDNYGSANSCMNQCWFDIHHFYPVVKRKRAANAWVFRCLFCCRDYTNEMGAYNCAQRCVGIKNKAQLREQILNELPLPPPSRPVSRLIMLTKAEPPARRPQSKPLPKRKAVPEIISEEKVKVNAVGELSPIPAEPTISFSDAGTPALEVEIFRGQHRDSFKKQIDRKGEKYQCQYCREIHFTKVEAQACFDAHFNSEGFENVVSIDPNA